MRMDYNGSVGVHRRGDGRIKLTDADRDSAISNDLWGRNGGGEQLDFGCQRIAKDSGTYSPFIHFLDLLFSGHSSAHLANLLPFSTAGDTTKSSEHRELMI